MITERAGERGGGGVVGLRIGDFDIRRGVIGGEVSSGIDNADTFDEGGGGECKLGTGDVGGMLESGIRSADRGRYSMTRDCSVVAEELRMRTHSASVDPDS